MKLTTLWFVTMLALVVSSGTFASNSSTVTVGAGINFPALQSAVTETHAGLNGLTTTASTSDGPDEAVLNGTTSVVVPKHVDLPECRYLRIKLKIMGIDLDSIRGKSIELDTTEAGYEAIRLTQMKSAAKANNKVIGDATGAFKYVGEMTDDGVVAGPMKLTMGGLMLIDTWQLSLGQHCIEYSVTHKGNRRQTDVALVFHLVRKDKMTDSQLFTFTVQDPSVYFDQFSQNLTRKDYADADPRVKLAARQSFIEHNAQAFVMVRPNISSAVLMDSIYREANKIPASAEKLTPVATGPVSHSIRILKNGTEFTGFVEVKTSASQSEPYLCQGPLVVFSNANPGSTRIWIREDGAGGYKEVAICVKESGVTDVALGGE